MKASWRRALLTTSNHTHMARLVQKFGGTSVKDAEHIRRVAKIVCDTAREGKQLIVVVSAMGHTTDDLISLSSQLTDEADPREMDMLLATGEQVSIALLAMAVQKLGLKARSFTGPQAGILTDETHTFARIKTVHPTRLEASLARGEIAVVAGFQGMTRTSEITTLGRGGSDTTAVALAAALSADCCDIYTDVNGVYTTDPRSCGGARKLHAISYQEMLELSSLGAQVLNARSVELAMKNRVPVRLRSTFEPADPGTLVTSRELVPDYKICGVACDTDCISFRLKFAHDFSAGDLGCPAPDLSEKLSRMLVELSAAGVPRSQVQVRFAADLLSEISFHCDKRAARSVRAIVAEFFPRPEIATLTVNTEVSQVSVVGSGLTEMAGVNAAILDTLSFARIPVSQITNRELSISAVVPSEYTDQAVQQLHEHFGLADTGR